MSAARTVHRQRAVMATDSEWERIGQAASAAGMEKSRCIIHRALAQDSLPREVMRRFVRETLVVSVLEKARLRNEGAAACAAVDAGLEDEGALGGRDTGDAS